jgi:putative two-component system response regulator
VIESRRRIHAAHLDTIGRLTIAAEYKEEHSAGHIARVGLSAAVLARAAGTSPGEVEMIRHAASMHDVGKIGIPDEVLLKQGRLDDGEMAIMREHTRIGATLLAASDSDVIQMGAKIALYHHEHWDGTGYPHGLAGEKIPREARVCGVVDYFDATTMERPHRPPLSQDWALDSMTEQRGERFDPALLDAFFDCLPEIRQIREEYPVQ